MTKARSTRPTALPVTRSGRAADRRGQGVLRLRDPRRAGRDARGCHGQAGKPRYNGAARDLGLPYRDDPNRVIRFKNPLEGTVVFDDLIKGRIEIANSEAG